MAVTTPPTPIAPLPEISTRNFPRAGCVRIGHARHRHGLHPLTLPERLPHPDRHGQRLQQFHEHAAARQDVNTSAHVQQSTQRRSERSGRHRQHRRGLRSFTDAERLPLLILTQLHSSTAQRRIGGNTSAAARQGVSINAKRSAAQSVRSTAQSAANSRNLQSTSSGCRAGSCTQHAQRSTSKDPRSKKSFKNRQHGTGGGNLRGEPSHGRGCTPAKKDPSPL